MQAALSQLLKDLYLLSRRYHSMIHVTFPQIVAVDPFSWKRSVVLSIGLVSPVKILNFVLQKLMFYIRRGVFSLVIGPKY